MATPQRGVSPKRIITEDSDPRTIVHLNVGGTPYATTLCAHHPV